MKHIHSFRRWSFIVGVFFATFVFESCTKLVEVAVPTDRIVDRSVYTNEETAIAVLTGIYINMSQAGTFTGNRSISLFAGLSADELVLYDGVVVGSYQSYYQNNLSAIDGTGSENWAPLYNYIFRCNAAIEGLQSTTSLDQAVRQQLLGEAKFLRAFQYFYLVATFGDVPIVLSADYNVNETLARSPREDVFKLIIADLEEAKSLLSTEYLDKSLRPYSGDGERVRPTSWAASALLARIYLYKGDYAGAEAQSTLVINNAAMYDLTPINDVFLKNSLEAIWQLQPVTFAHNTEDGFMFVLPDSGPDMEGNRSFYISDQLLNSFEAGDQRTKIGNWVNSVTVDGVTYHYPYKYKIGEIDAPASEYLMVLRLGEQYLIRAEARAQLNNISEAQSDLNRIRRRAGLPDTDAIDKTGLLSAILHERQVELFTEWGHRWLDLKRTGNVDRVMSLVTPLKANGNAWRPFQQWYPLPFSDIQKGPNLVQNPGY